MYSIHRNPTPPGAAAAGAPYDMGFAHGTLMNATMRAFLDDAWAYLEGQAESAINGSFTKLKPWFVDLLAEGGLTGALQLTVDATKPWTGAYFDEELAGMAAATGYDLARLRHIHMIGEATRGSCSMYGAWGSATAATGGNLLQLRALDWDMDGPFRDFPQLTVYHPTPNTGNGRPFVNIGWTGFIGSITGFSSAQMAISEIGVSFPDSTFGLESRFGVPFTYLLRDVLQFDADLGAAMSHLTAARRTCDLILGVGDGKGGLFRSVQYSAEAARFYDDTNMMPVADWHPRMDNIVYYGMDWLCPGYTTVLHAQLTALHGNLTAEATIQDVTAIVQTGDLHIAIYDLTNMVLHTANARRSSAWLSLGLLIVVTAHP
jgi:isopenicillin-N N-acyltransferase-like protein